MKTRSPRKSPADRPAAAVGRPLSRRSWTRNTLGRQLREDTLASAILWGPPGCGKTTLARLVQHHTKRPFTGLSAVLSGLKEVREVMERARGRWRDALGATILFMDEIHRFNKAQQDAFLPYLEEGSVVLLGTTTENPSFHLTPALLSRCRVVTLRRSARRTLSVLRRGSGRDRWPGGGDPGRVRRWPAPPRAMPFASTLEALVLQYPENKRWRPQSPAWLQSGRSLRLGGEGTTTRRALTKPSGTATRTPRSTGSSDAGGEKPSPAGWCAASKTSNADPQPALALDAKALWIFGDARGSWPWPKRWFTRRGTQINRATSPPRL